MSVHSSLRCWINSPDVTIAQTGVLETINCNSALTTGAARLDGPLSKGLRPRGVVSDRLYPEPSAVELLWRSCFQRRQRQAIVESVYRARHRRTMLTFNSPSSVKPDSRRRLSMVRTPWVAISRQTLSLSSSTTCSLCRTMVRSKP